MANPYRGEVELQVENEAEELKCYTLIYDGNALVEIEEALGVSMGAILRDPEMMNAFRFQRTALYQGLRRDPKGRKVTLTQCGELICSPQRAKILHAVTRGIFLAMGVDIDAPEVKAAAGEDDGDKHPLAATV